MSYLNKQQSLATDAYQEIKRNPGSWDQELFRSYQSCDTTRCGSRLCWGGHIVAMDDGVFLTNDPLNDYYSFVLARSSDPKEDVETLDADGGRDSFTFGMISVSDRLKSILKVDSDAYEELIHPGNTLDDLRTYIVKHLHVDPETGEKVTPKSVCHCGDPYCKAA